MPKAIVSVMNKINFLNGRELKPGDKPYIIAEINTSHFGSMDKAIETIEKTAETGCDCIKFQSWTSKTLYSESYYKNNPIAKRFVKKLSLTNDQLKELSNVCKLNNIDFASTPYSKSEADFLLRECSVPFIKISSMEINNYDFLEYVASTNAPIIMSTGMATYDEVRSAVNLITKKHNSNLIILHCVSVYPTPPKSAQLHNISALRDLFPGIPVGYSDHTEGIVITTAATVYKPCVIEKHVTLDSSVIGMDNQMAIEIDELQKMVENVSIVHQSLGSSERRLEKLELEQRSKMRRSLVANNSLETGHLITKDDIVALRPGNGLPVTMLNDILGKKLLRPIQAGDLFEENHFLAS